jgi:hypothetical protein
VASKFRLLNGRYGFRFKGIFASSGVQKGNRTPEEANMPLKRKPYRPLSNLNFEATRQIDSGKHKEWSKYVIGLAA